MKKLFLLTLSVITFMSISSCRDDDDETVASIVGIWKPVKQVVYSGNNGVVIHSENVDICYAQSTFNFKSNGELVSNVSDYDLNGNCVSTEDTTGYNYNTNSKILTVDGEQNEVITLTNNTLEFILEMDDYDGDGIDDTITYIFAR